MKTRIMASAVAATPSSHDESDDETENLSSSSTSSPIITTLLHPDIIHTHILARLDAATLAAASSVSSELRHLCTDEVLWRNVCTATWPSLLDPIASHVISTFPGGHRFFFSDAFPSLLYQQHLPNSHANHRNRTYPPPPPPELIFAVDIYCEGKPLFSRVQVQRSETQNYNSFFQWLPLMQVDQVLLVPNPVKANWKLYLEENFTLSWILIDPTRKRAANLSSWKPVSVRGTSDVEVEYAVVMEGEDQQGLTEPVLCMVKVTCSGKVGKELHVKNVSMEMKNWLGWPVRGKEGVMILQRAMENGNFLCKMTRRREIMRKKAVALARKRMHV